MRVKYPIDQTDSGIVSAAGTPVREEEGELISISIGTIAPGQLAAFAFVRTDDNKLAMAPIETLTFV